MAGASRGILWSVLGKNGSAFSPLGGETPELMLVLSVSALVAALPPELSFRSVRRSRPCLDHTLCEAVRLGVVKRDHARSFELPGSKSSHRTRVKSSSFPCEASGAEGARGRRGAYVRSFWLLRYWLALRLIIPQTRH